MNCLFQVRCKVQSIWRELTDIRIPRVTFRIHSVPLSGKTCTQWRRQGGKCFPKIIFCPPPPPKSLVVESHGCGSRSGRGATFVNNGQMLLENLSWIGKIVKIYEILLKNYILVCMEKFQGVKNFGDERVEISWNSILPPKNTCRPSNVPSKFWDLAPPLHARI